MNLLICVLNQTDKLNELVEALAGLGVSRATVIESQGMARIMAERDIPVFSGFRHLLGADRPFNYTIFSVIQDPVVAADILEAIQQRFKASSGGHGVAFLLPVSHFVTFGTS